MKETERKKILLIEDDIELGENVKEILEDEDYNIELEVDGKSGTNRAFDWRPDLIICDIALPNMDGFEVLEQIRKEEKTKKLPFIFLTAKVKREDIRKGMMLGADDYIFKPFEIDDLKNSINLRFERVETPGDNEKNLHYGDADQVIIHSGNKMHVCSMSSIKYLKSETPYVRFKLENGKSYIERGTLNEWELKLPIDIFIRVHRSSIVNTKFINKIERISKTSYVIHLENEEEPIVVSRRYSSKVKSVFNS